MATDIDWNASLRRALTRETLTSVRLRAVILAVLILVGLLLYLIATYLPEVTSPVLVPKLRALAPQLLGLIAGALAYEGIVALWVTRWIGRGVEPLEEMNRAGQIPMTRIGIGLHAGNAVTGSLGSASRKEYAIIGNVVNTAARIEKLNKDFGSQLLVSAEVRNACAKGEEVGANLGEITVKGQTARLRVFKVA